MGTLYSIGGIAAIVNALIAGSILGWNLAKLSKRKEAVAPAPSLPVKVVVVVCHGLDDGMTPAPPAVSNPPDKTHGVSPDGGKPGDNPDDNT